MTRAVFILTILCFTAATTAQPAGVELILEGRTLEAGEAINAQLVCTNTGTPDLPQTTVPEGLDLKLVGSRPSAFTQTTIVNGKMTRKTTYTYTMRLTAVKEGTHVLGPISVTADGTRYQTKPVRIVVHEPNTAGSPRGDQYVFVELEVEPESLYVTETYTATLVVGIRQVELNGRIYNVDTLGLLNARGTNLSVFAGLSKRDVRRSEVRLRDSNGVQHRFDVHRLTRNIRAEAVGEATVGPVFVRIDYPTRLRRGFWGNFEASRHRKETARATAVTVDVKGPPEEGRPPTFTGAIGRFAMKATAKPTSVEQGQPVTLTISVSGAPLVGVAAPDLARDAELASRFDFARDELVGDLQGGAKVFRRAVFPKQPGEQTIPPIEWSYFDPRTERYVTLVSDAISLTVDPPSPSATTITLLEESQSETEETILTLLTGGISPNYIDADTVLADQSIAMGTPWLGPALGLPPLFWLMVTLTARHRTRLRGDAGFARRRQARKRADACIRRALDDGRPIEQWQGLSQAMTGYLSDRFNLPPGQLTPDEARSLLTEHACDQTMVGDVGTLLETCDGARYASTPMSDKSIDKAAANVRRWIKMIERTTR